MKQWKVAVLCAALVACFAFALTGCSVLQSSGGNYTPEPNAQSVDDSALCEKGTLRVGVDTNSAPLAGQTSSSSQIVGIDVDIAAAIADELGLKLTIVDVGKDPQSALEAGNVDIVMGIDNSQTESKFWRSDAYLSTGVALFAPPSTTSVPALNSSPKIAAQVSSKSSWRVTNLFGDASLVSKNDLKSAYEALASGSAQYVAADAVIGTYVVHTNDFDAQVLALLQDPSGYCIGVKSSNQNLQTAVADAIGKLSDGGVVDIIETKWLGAPLDLSGITVMKAAVVVNGSATESSNSDEESSDS